MLNYECSLPGLTCSNIIVINVSELATESTRPEPVNYKAGENRFTIQQERTATCTYKLDMPRRKKEATALGMDLY